MAEKRTKNDSDTNPDVDEKTLKQLGIVYTPQEIIDFILHSVDDVLQKEFGRRLTDENVNIIEPFCGDGRFITTLINSGLINPEDLNRKYDHEIEMMEIEPHAFELAKRNVEAAYFAKTGKEKSFLGIRNTDTFQEYEDSNGYEEGGNWYDYFDHVDNPTDVVFSNPPYFMGVKRFNEHENEIKQEKKGGTERNDKINISSIHPRGDPKNDRASAGGGILPWSSVVVRKTRGI